MTDKHSESGRSLTYGNGGRFSPSDSKSQANSDSSYVRFKVFKNLFVRDGNDTSNQSQMKSIMNLFFF